MYVIMSVRCTAGQSVKKVQPQRSVKVRSAKVGASDIDLIQCCVCKLWSHSVCCGLIPKDYNRLKANGQYFKCTICCVKSLGEFSLSHVADFCQNHSIKNHHSQPAVSPIVNQLHQVCQINRYCTTQASS